MKTTLAIRIPAELRQQINAAVIAAYPETLTQFVLRSLIRELHARNAALPLSAPGARPNYSAYAAEAFTASSKKAKSPRSHPRDK